MTNKIVWNYDLLEKLAERDNFKVHQKYDKYTIKSRIDFECSCGKVYNKSFKQLYEAGGLCKECGIKRLSQTARERNLLKNQAPGYTKELLKDIVLRDKCVIDFNNIINYYKKGKINFICSCGIEHQKMFEHIVLYGAYCKECTIKKSVQKYKETCQERYGCISTLQVKEVRDKGKETWVAKLGVDHPLKSKDVQDRKKATCMETMGVPHQFASKEVQAKCENTMVAKYNVKSNMHCAEIAQKQLKSAFRPKEYIFPDGVKIMVQGYEPFLLDILVKEGYTSSDIITDRTEVPEIWYMYKIKQRRYYCDVYIPKTNTIYEVKSKWTYEKDVNRNKLKEQACLDTGYNFELFIFNKKGEILDIAENKNATIV